MFKIDYEFKFVDREGNELKSTNTTGTTRTSKRHPNVSLRVKDSQIDSVTIGINIKNEDDIEFHNYMYVVKKSDGSIIKQDSVVGSEIVLTDLETIISSPTARTPTGIVFLEELPMRRI